MVYDILRDASAPLPTADIADRLIQAKGIPVEDRSTRALITKTVLGSLNRASDTIERVTQGGVVCWKVAA
jgi:hypothetical protein